MVENITALDLLAEEHTQEVRELLATVDHHSVFEDYGTFQVLIIRRMTLAEASLSFISEPFLFKDGNVYKFDRAKEAVLKQATGYEGLFGELERYYSANQKIIQGYSDEIEKLEDSLFERKIPGYFMDIWFDLKKDLAKIENFYYRNSVVYKEFYKICEKSLKQWTDELRDIDDLINFQSSNLVTLKARMDSLHHYYDSIKADRLNKTLLALTLISGIFLPLNLIVGFFGMNTEGLFFKDDPNATQTVTEILLAIVVLSFLGAPIIKMVDKYLLRKLLGRYDFYKSISKRAGTPVTK